MPSHHTPLHLRRRRGRRRARRRAADRSQGRDAAAPRAGRSRGRLLRDREGAEGQNPAQVAQEIAAAFQPTELLASATAAGPFVNFQANRAAAFRWLVDAALGGSLLPRSSAPARRSASTTARRTSPSTSPITTSAARRSATRSRRSSARSATRSSAINFLGDWGTTHGMVLAAYEQLGRRRRAARRSIVLNAALRAVPRRGWQSARGRGPRVAQEARGRRAEARRAVEAVPRRCRGPSSRRSTRSSASTTTRSTARRSSSRAATPRVDGAARERACSSRARARRSSSSRARRRRSCCSRRTARRSTRPATSRRPSIAWDTYHSDALALRRRSRPGPALPPAVQAARRRWATTWAKRCQHIPYGLVRVGGKKTGDAHRQRRADARRVQDRRGRGARA